MDDVNNNDAQKALKQLQDKAKAARLAAEQAAEQEAQYAEQIHRLLAEEEARLVRVEAEKAAAAKEAARVAAAEAAAERERVAAAEAAAEKEAARVTAAEAEREAAVQAAAAEREAARVAAVQAAAADELEKARVAAKRAKREKAKREKAAKAAQFMEAAATASKFLDEHDRRVAKGMALAQTATMQAGVATSFVKDQRMPKFDSKGVEDDDGSGHRTEGDSSEDDAGTMHKGKGKKRMKRPHGTDEESSGPNKKPRMNTSTELVPAGDVSNAVCDECFFNGHECLGRTLASACYRCKGRKKACKIDGHPIRGDPNSPRQPADSVIAVNESSDPIIAQGSQVVALARSNLELAKRVQGFESLILGLYRAAISEQDLVPVVNAYFVRNDKANGGKARQTDDNKALD